MSKSSSSPLPYMIGLAVLAACAMVNSHRPAQVTRPLPAPPPTVEAQAPAVTPASKTRIVLVSVDGMSSALVDHMPNLKKMFEDGDGTFKAEVPLGATTAISHAALFTGADPKVNGVTCEPSECKGDGYVRADAVHGVDFRYRSPPLQVKDTLFTAVEGAGYKAVAYVQKGKLVGYFRPDADETGILSTNDANEVVKGGCAALGDDRLRLAVLHFKMIDDAGHRVGWLTESQLGEAAKIDGQLQQVRDCVDRANARGGVQTLLIVTADHGGRPGRCWRKGKERSCEHGWNDDDDRLVPWLILGPGIRQGVTLAERADLSPVVPGGAHPSILLIDTVPTILHLLGIPETSIPTLSKDAKPVGDLLLSATQ